MKRMDFLRKEILRTGFPVEMEILSFLNSGNWWSAPNDYYFDYDLNIARDIDMRATYNPPSRSEETRGFDMSYFLAVECKKSEANAWVFFKAKFARGRKPRYLCSGQYADYLRSQDITRVFSPIVFLLLNNLHYYAKACSMSYTQVKMFKSSHSDNVRDSKTRHEIFEALNQVIKYVSYEIGDYLELFKVGGTVKTNQCFIFFPVIVFDGQMYLASSTNGDVKLQKVKHVVLTVFYKPKYETRRCPFFVDIVTRGYFPEYLSRLESEINGITEKIARIPDINQLFIDALGGLSVPAKAS